MHGLDGRGGNAAEASSEYEPAGRAVAFFPAGRVVSVLSGLQGVSGEAQPGGAVQEGEE
jgi:hypothetical protein